MNYQEIIDAGVAYADRFTDIEIAANLDTFLRLGEARLQRLLKVRKASKQATLPMSADLLKYSVPPDFGGIRTIKIIPSEGNGKEIMLRYLNPEQMTYQTQFTGEASVNNSIRYYTIEANQFLVDKTGAGDVLQITYYQRVPPLTADDNSNWVSDDHPDMYLSLLMYEIELFAKNYDVAEGWKGRLDVAINELEITDIEERWSGNPLETRLDLSYIGYPERRAG